MIASIQIELDHNRKRHGYYCQLLEKTHASKKSSINKWIEIYDERVQKLARQLARAQKQAAEPAAPVTPAPLGLKTQLKSTKPAKSSKRA